MAAAVPFALKAGAMVGGSLLGKKLSGPSGAQNQAMQQAQQSASALSGMATPLLQQGRQLTQQGGQQLGAAGDYYTNILSNRRAASESLAPEMATAMDYYKGASNKVQRTQRGGSRDYALAELDRQKVGNMAMMLPAARANAAQGAAGVGGSLLSGGASAAGQGVNAASNAAYVNSRMFGDATTLRDQEGEGGKAWGSILYDAAQGLFGGGKKPLPSTNPNTFFGTPGIPR